MNVFYQFAWFIPIIPLFSAIIGGVGLIGFRKATQSFQWRYAIICGTCMGLAMVYSFILLYFQYIDSNYYEYNLNWFIDEPITLQLGFRIDSLSTIMCCVVTTVSLLVMVYSHGYMKYDLGYTRFFSYLSLFSSSMLGLVLSPNLIQIYIFWELIGMCSYLLIGFWSTRASAGDACQKAFIFNRVGDFGFFLGLLGFFLSCGTVNCTSLPIKVAEQIVNQPNISWFFIICSILLILGPFAKSAQFPLHGWLPDAMEGPTPISALIHAATLVAAGVFLTARLLPVFSQLPYVCTIISYIGALTAFLGATIALTQQDLKKGLAYSTVSQLGYMFMALGLGAYSSALFHLITHAYSKALLFLSAGSVIHGMEGVIGYNPSKSQNIFLMGGLKKYMPTTRLVFLIGTISLCGLPPFSCFWSKDAILSQAFKLDHNLWFVGWLTAGLTSFYMFRLYFLTFEGDFMLSDKKPKESDKSFLIPLCILCLPSMFIGFFGSPFNNIFCKFFNQDLETFDLNEFLITAGSSIFIAIFGLLISYLIYRNNRYSMNVSNILIKNINLFFEKKWYIDVFYQYSFVNLTRNFSLNLLSFDKTFIDGTVNFISVITLFIGEFLKYITTGRLKTYLSVVIGSICVLYFYL